jgi:hypothetical protein
MIYFNDDDKKKRIRGKQMRLEIRDSAVNSDEYYRVKTKIGLKECYTQ